MTLTALAVLGRGLVDPATPLLRADDLGVLRGDGIFETMHVRSGKPWLLDEHLARMARSARRMELALPPEEQLRELAEVACSAADPAIENTLRLVCTRGPEGADTVTCFAGIAPVTQASVTPRTRGVSVNTISLGFTAGARGDAPWLLGGVKSLSYAVNMASQRWALSQGVDDVLWLSADGFVLEAPTSTLVWRSGDRLLTVPVDATGILPGTTARHLLDRSFELDLAAGEEMITAAALTAASGAWLLSSVRGIAEIRSLDGVALPASPDTARIRSLLGF
ncbi:aminotransferase class IV [Hamadaea tsunoensis]|uniref:aminotransferase class IV n=1 Tax=Hamadaea tsunoensis TaxID=53368 RepID=UPI0004853D81|nr:aminotransferase class IV [Hamadaea tsunoensis]